MKRASVIIVGMHNAGRALLSQKLFWLIFLKACCYGAFE